MTLQPAAENNVNFSCCFLEGTRLVRRKQFGTFNQFLRTQQFGDDCLPNPTCCSCHKGVKPLEGEK